MADTIMICRHNKTGTGVCDILGGYCVEGPCSAEELVEYAPVKHGRWIVKRYAPGGRGRTVRFCSECGANNLNRKSNYCPNCGCRMEGEEYAVD